jgi:uncharacterized protein (DUF1330 family)
MPNKIKNATNESAMTQTNTDKSISTFNIDPSRAQFDLFKALPRDTPIMMLNLIQLRADAQYPDGQTATGAVAYKAYSEETSPIFAELGGQIIWRGRPECMLIGPAEEKWDLAFIARYPHAGAFMAMITDARYKQAVVHRQAAVQDSRLIRLGETPEGAGFGE